MLKFKLARQCQSLLISSLSHSHCSIPCIPLLLFVQDKAYSSTPHTNSEDFVLVEYLTDSLKFPKRKAIAVSRRFPSISSSEKPEAVIRFLKTFGISDTQIQSCLQCEPSILFRDVEKTLKPKIAFCQGLGLSEPHLGLIIYKNPFILSSSLDRNLKPSIEVIKEALELNGSENCHVVGTQLIMLLKTEPRLLSLPEAQLKLLVSRATEMGSRMLVYGITSIYCCSAETLHRKFELLQGFGFSKDGVCEVTVKLPTLLRTSEAKLRRGIEFYLHTLMLDKSTLVRAPSLLSISMEKRVIPRCKLLEALRSRNLLKKEPSCVTWLLISNKKFAERYILRFPDDAKLLQVANKYNILESSIG